MLLLLIVPALSACILPDGSMGSQGAVVFEALEPASGGRLFPSQIIEWQSSLPNGTLQEVIFESAGHRTVICKTVDAQCFAPTELLADTEYEWWVRAVTSKGIVRSDSFYGVTDRLDAQLEAEVPDRLPPTGRFSWTASGPDVISSVAIYMPKDGGPVTACTGNGCKLSEPLRASTTYDADLRAHGASGLYIERSLTDLSVNKPPTSVRAISPQVGAEVGIGEARLQWSPSMDPEQDEVSYRLLWTRAEDGAWQDVQTGHATSTSLAVQGAESYAWRVESTDAAGNTNLSPMFFFKTPDAPPAAILSEGAAWVPPEGKKTFEWIGSTSSQTVEFREAGSTAEWASACSGTNTCTTQLRAEPGVTYEWRVQNQDEYSGTSYSAIGTFETTPLVVLLHGLRSSGETWETGANALISEGFHVLDVDPTTGLLESLSYKPSSDSEGIRETTLNAVAPQINTALAAAGYPTNRPVILVGHSMGGLAARVLVDENALDHDVSRIITLGTPHQGSIWADGLVQAVGKKATVAAIAGLLARVGVGLSGIVIGAAVDAAFSPWQTAIDDLSPRSEFIAGLPPSDIPIWAVAGTDDLVVSVSSAIAQAEKTRLVPLGHGQLTGKFCYPLEQSCSIDGDAVDVVDEWLRLRE